MCIFKFNPPAPSGPCRFCRTCPCVPRYWRLDSPAFVSTHISPISYPASSTVLEMSLPDSGSGHCYWTQRTDILQGTDFTIRPKISPDFMTTWDEWVLGTFISLPLRPLSIDPNVVFDEWVLYLPDPGLVAYTRAHTSGMQDDPDFDPTQFLHFDCLSPNTFYYQGTESDPGGEDDPEIWGWPPTLTITPYYP